MACAAVGVEVHRGVELVALSDGRPDRQTEGVGGLERVDDVQVVRPGLGEVLPRMHGGVGTDEARLPVARRALLIVALQRLTVVSLFVAEQRAERLELTAVPHQPIPEVVSDLVPEMAKQRAIRLVHRDPALLAPHVVSLGQRNGDEAVIVSRHHPRRS